MTFSSSLAVGLSALISLSTGCTDSTQPVEPPAPPLVSQPTAPSALPPAFPALSRAGVIYEDPGSIYGLFSTYHGSRLASRYILYENGALGLQFSGLRFGFFEYAGKYSRADSLITFSFNDSNTAGPWEATGTLRGDSLSVRYNIVMGMADFVDGVYVRSAETQ